MERADAVFERAKERRREWHREQMHRALSNALRDAINRLPPDDPVAESGRRLLLEYEAGGVK